MIIYYSKTKTLLVTLIGVVFSVLLIWMFFQSGPGAQYSYFGLKGEFSETTSALFRIFVFFSILFFLGGVPAIFRIIKNKWVAIEINSKGIRYKNSWKGLIPWCEITGYRDIKTPFGTFFHLNIEKEFQDKYVGKFMGFSSSPKIALGELKVKPKDLRIEIDRHLNCK